MPGLVQVSKKKTIGIKNIGYAFSYIKRDCFYMCFSFTLKKEKKKDAVMYLNI